MNLRILGKASSINVRKVLWTCHELGLSIEREDWGSGFQPTDTPAFRALNPNAMVPVLVEPSEPARGGEADFVLWESNTICRYLTAREGRHDLLGPTLHERARVEQWMDWQATELNNSWRYAFMALVRHSPRTPTRRRCRPGWTPGTRTCACWTRSWRAPALSSRRGLHAGRRGAGPVGAALVHDADGPARAARGARLVRAPAQRDGFRLHGCNGLP
jgi:hypothetical protein